MPEQEFELQLDDLGLEWLRVRFATEIGQVTSFMVQYETTVRGQRFPVVRYDTAHGFPHRDVLDRRGRVIDKVQVVNTPSLGIALADGKQDIQSNWPLYRRAFFASARGAEE